LAKRGSSSKRRSADINYCKRQIKEAIVKLFGKEKCLASAAEQYLAAGLMDEM